MTPTLVETALEVFNGGLVRETDTTNPRGFTTYYKPTVAMQSVLDIIHAHYVALAADERVVAVARREYADELNIGGKSVFKANWQAALTTALDKMKEIST